ncbi:MAG: uracil-DNA glycosylase [Acidobacteria bacterium]|nr:uracil-DNA glycosylase [Acidobacteriota bacterium]
MTPEATARLRAYVEYFRDLGVYDFYRHGEVPAELQAQLAEILQRAKPASPRPDTSPAARSSAPAAAPKTLPPPPAKPSLSPFEASKQRAVAQSTPAPAPPQEPAALDPALAPPPMPLISLNERIAPPQTRVTTSADKHAALESIRHHIGDCTRCPLAYAGRHTIVFADGSPDAKLMFVGEGPGADEDTSGVPFVGKAGQLLNNMITAMGLKREEVYIANVVKCRPPGNRTPEPIEANTCSQFLAEQIDVVQPEYIVALGATAATYLLGIKKPLTALRGSWHEVRGAKVAVTYHPAYLLRDPNMKGEAWKDLQRVMVAMGLKSPKRS